MFERYTETARRTVLLGRHEASTAGSAYIETHHLLLGILRADPALATRVFHSKRKIEQIRRRIAQEAPPNSEPISTAVDLPLTEECKRVLDHASRESQLLEQKHITTGHLLFGIVRELKSIAARIVLESGITFEELKEHARETNETKPTGLQSTSDESLRAVRDLVTDARNGALTPLIGREREMEQLMRALSRRTNNSVVLLGEPGVGKHSLICGLAQRIAQDDVPADFCGRPILMVDSWTLADQFPPALHQVLDENDPILYVRGLFDRRDVPSGITGYLANGNRQAITTGAPLSFRLALERYGNLARRFQPVAILPPSEEESVQIASSAAKQLESFHGVVISPEAIGMAVSASGRFLRDYVLPERALDLIDDACTLVKLRRSQEPPEIASIEKRVRATLKALEHSIANFEFEKARQFSFEERQLREEIIRLREAMRVAERSSEVSSGDVIEAVAARSLLTVPAVIAALQQPQGQGARDTLLRELSAQIPIGRQDWVEGFAAYLANCASDETETLFEAMRTAKAKFDRSSQQ